MSPYYSLLNYVILLTTWVAVYYLWPSTVKYSNIYRRKMERFTLVYLAFPMYNIEDPHDVYALWFIYAHTLIYHPIWIVMYIVPWVFFIAVIWNDTYLEEKRVW